MIRRNLVVEKVSSPEQKDGKISMSFIASTSAVDRYGDVIDQNGWSLESYKSNAIVLFNHDASELPIAKGSVDVVDGNLMIDIDFDMKDPRAAEIGRKTRDGYLNAVSVGFNPIESVKRSDLPEDHFAKGADGMFFLKSELLEVSVVTIPANSEAVAAKQFSNSAEERVFRRIAKHILDIIEEEERFIVYYAKEPKEEDEVIEEEEEELDEEYEEGYSDDSEDEEEEKYLKTLLGEKPNQPATETDEIKSLSYLISLMQTDK